MKNRKFTGPLSICFLMLFVSFKLIGSTQQPEKGDIDFPVIVGLKIIYDYPVYYPDNLWDYINGAADSYLDFDFQDLHIAEYVKGDTTYKAEVYRHKDPIYAFGIYALERSPDYLFIDLGVQGYGEESLIHFVKGVYYVKITTYSGSNEAEKILKNIAESLNNILPGENKLPEVFQFFCNEGKVPNTEHFISNNFIGYSFMEEVYTTGYKISDNSFTMFILSGKDEKEAEEILINLLSRANKKEDNKAGFFTVHDPYNGTIYIGKSGKYLIGGYELDNPDLFESNFNFIRERVDNQ